jgi:hypothetical protein
MSPATVRLYKYCQEFGRILLSWRWKGLKSIWLEIYAPLLWVGHLKWCIFSIYTLERLECSMSQDVESMQQPDFNSKRKSRDIVEIHQVKSIASNPASCPHTQSPNMSERDGIREHVLKRGRVFIHLCKATCAFLFCKAIHIPSSIHSSIILQIWSSFVIVKTLFYYSIRSYECRRRSPSTLTPLCKSHIIPSLACHERNEIEAEI